MLAFCLIAGLLLVLLPRLQTPELPGLVGQAPLENAQTALYELEARAALNGWTAEAHQQAAVYWRDMGDLSRALPHWEAAVAINPDADTLRRIADLYLQAGRWGLAAQTLEQLLALNPEERWARWQLGLLLAPGDPIRARQHLQRIALDDQYGELSQRVLANLPISPADTLAGSRIGAILAEARLWPQAENAFQYAADLNSPYPEALAYVGLMRGLQGKASAPWVDTALAYLAADSGRFADQQARVYLAAGLERRVRALLDQSTELLLLARSLDPYNPAIYTELAANAQQAGDDAGARFWLDAATRLLDQDLTRLAEDPFGGSAQPDTALRSAFEQILALNIAPESGGPDQDFGILPEPDADARADAAFRLHSQGYSLAALQDLDTLLGQFPDLNQALLNKARILIEVGSPRSAAPLLEILLGQDEAYARFAELLLDQIAADLATP